jgi:hypothetical protein
MTEALYWTASTIAQTLAGAVALSGAVVLYALQDIAREIGSLAELLQNRAPFSSRDKLWNLRLQHRETEMVVRVRKALAEHRESSKSIKSTARREEADRKEVSRFCDLMEQLCVERAGIVFRLKCALGACAFMILYSLAVLGGCSLPAPYPWLPAATLIAMCLGTVVCVVYLGYMILTALPGAVPRKNVASQTDDDAPADDTSESDAVAQQTQEVQ